MAGRAIASRPHCPLPPFRARTVCIASSRASLGYGMLARFASLTSCAFPPAGFACAWRVCRHAIQGIIARAITSRNHRASVPRRGQGACIFPAARDSKVAVPRGPVPLCTRRAKLSIPMGFLLTARREFDWFPPHRLRMHRCVPLAGILLLACRRADIRRRRAYEMSSRNEFSSRWRLRKA